MLEIKKENEIIDVQNNNNNNNRADVHRCMESLMLLLGTSPLHPVPIWLRSICGRFLSKILLRPNGVATVIEFTVGDVENGICLYLGFFYTI